MDDFLKKEILEKYNVIPTEKLIAHAVGSNKFVCVWIEPGGVVRVVHSEMNLPDLAFASKLIDINIHKTIAGNEVPRK